MKKTLTILLALLLALGVFAGCNLKLDDDDGTGDVSGEIDFNVGSDYTDKIKVWVTNNESELKLMKAFVDSFNQVYPNIEVD